MAGAQPHGGISPRSAHAAGDDTPTAGAAASGGAPRTPDADGGEDGDEGRVVTASASALRTMHRHTGREFLRGVAASFTAIAVTFPINKLTSRQAYEGLSTRQAFATMRADGAAHMYRGLLLPIQPLPPPLVAEVESAPAPPEPLARRTDCDLLSPAAPLPTSVAWTGRPLPSKVSPVGTGSSMYAMVSTPMVVPTGDSAACSANSEATSVVASVSAAMAPCTSTGVASSSTVATLAAGVPPTDCTTNSRIISGAAGTSAVRASSTAVSAYAGSFMRLYK